MITATIVFACCLIIVALAFKRGQEYQEERAQIVEQAKCYDHGC